MTRACSRRAATRRSRAASSGDDMRRPYASPVASLLRYAAALVGLVILLGFAIFVYEEAEKGSRAQVERLESDLARPELTPRDERARERRHGPVREGIDDANDVLL